MKKALLVIDAQKIYTDIENDYWVEGSEAILANINQLIEKFESDRDTIIYIRHIHSADGSDAGRMFDFLGNQENIEFVDGTELIEYSSNLRIAPNAFHIIKHRYDSFIGTSLRDILLSNLIEKIVIVGFMSNFCCESTARTAHDNDFYVDFIRDATGTPGTEELSSEATIAATCATLMTGFAKVMNTSEYLRLGK